MTKERIKSTISNDDIRAMNVRDARRAYDWAISRAKWEARMHALAIKDRHKRRPQSTRTNPAGMVDTWGQAEPMSYRERRRQRMAQ